MANAMLGLGPKAAGLALRRASELLDELPVLRGGAAKAGLGHAVRGDELFNVGEKAAHGLHHMRVATPMSTKNAGNCPLLRVSTPMGQNGVMTDAVKIDLQKLRQLVVENTGAGKKMSRRALSLAATGGRNPDLVRDLMKVTNRKPTLETAAGICAALSVDLSTVVKGVPAESQVSEWLTVCQSVQAGVWREAVEWEAEDMYRVKVGAPLVDGERFGAVVEGRSMDRTIPPGTILECVPIPASGILPQSGDYVIVERVRNDLHEVTCKRLNQREDGDFELVAESTLPEFAEPWHIGQPDFQHENDDEVRVVALVIRAHLQLFQPLRRMELEKAA